MRAYPLARLLSAGTFLVLLLAGCQKESDDDNGGLSEVEESRSAQISNESEIMSEASFDDVFNQVLGVNDDVGMAGLGVFGQKAPDQPTETARVDSNRCFTVTTTLLAAPLPFPRKVVIDFGAGCTGRDGRLRSGKIITVYTGRLIVPGKMATTTFDGYKVDSVLVEGTHRIKNTSTSNALQFTIDVIDGKLTRLNGDYIERTAHRIKTQFEGLGTPLYPMDDVFRLEGHSNGNTRRSNHLTRWQSEITDPLFKKFNCRYITKGVIRTRREYLPSNTPWVGILNFGNGLCDNQATLIINGVSHQITLH
jgi:hypothetical protein